MPRSSLPKHTGGNRCTLRPYYIILFCACRRQPNTLKFNEIYNRTFSHPKNFKLEAIETFHETMPAVWRQLQNSNIDGELLSHFFGSFLLLERSLLFLAKFVPISVDARIICIYITNYEHDIDRSTVIFSEN